MLITVIRLIIKIMIIIRMTTIKMIIYRIKLQNYFFIFCAVQKYIIILFKAYIFPPYTLIDGAFFLFLFM